MQRLLQIWWAIMIVLGTSIACAQEDEANPLRWDGLEVTNPRHVLVEEHVPEIRREADPVVIAVKAEAQPDPEPEPDPEPNMQRPVTQAASLRLELEQELQNAKDSEAITDEQRAVLTGLLEKSLASVRSTEETHQNRERILDEIVSVPERLEQLKNELLVPALQPEKPDLSSEGLESLEAKLAEISALLGDARERLKKHQARSSELQNSRKESQKTLSKLTAQRDEITQQLKDQEPEDVSAQQQQAWRTELETRRRLHEAETKLLQAEVDLAKASTELHPLQNDLIRREIANLEAKQAIWQAAVADERDAEAARQIEAAQKKARETDADLKELANENERIAQQRQEFAGKLDGVTLELSTHRDSFAKQEKSFDAITKRIDDIGMTEAIGVLLRAQERELVDARPVWIRAREIEKELPKIELLVIETHEQQEAMWDLDGMTEAIVRDPSSGLLSRHSHDSAFRMVRELLSTRRQYLFDLNRDLQTYQMDLADLHHLLQKVARTTADHRSYIDEHVLWIRSAELVSADDVVTAKMGIAELLDPPRWRQVLLDVGIQLQRHLYLWLLLLALFTVGLVVSDRLKDRISTVGNSKAVRSHYRFVPTVEVAAETLTLALLFPAAMYLLSRYLTRFPQASLLEQAIGDGLRWTSLMWMGLSLLQQVVRKDGLAEAHFGWHSRNVAVIRRNLRLLTTCGLPAVFAVMVISSFRNGDYMSSLGRLSFMAGMSVMALFAHRLLDPYRTSNGVWANREVWLYRIRHVVHACAVLIPISLTVVSGLGYVYSANQLAFRAQLSLWLVLGVVLCQAMLGRYLRIARRAAAVRHMQHRRAEIAENSEAEIPVEEEIDFKSIDGQVRRLLRGGTAVAMVLGVLVIWADMVPALKILQRVQLWHVQTMSADGETAIQWITLADVLLGVSALLATVMAARNVPGLLNITVFERLPIDYGTRYALTAVSRYLISLVGIVVAFQCVGVTWHSVQWLVAAVTVGLGFGLQEIFANFVSGLIIFTERPVRVGDMVTVGGVTGKVTRVQIRATTITDFDRRELVVPNKRFITEDVINWTLSDPISRVVLPVGIAYSCDPEVACKELMRVAYEHPLVLKEPEASGVFVGFGDSTLDLELRVFIVGRDNVFQVRNELNMAINHAFKHASLEIAYPQRDLHIRSAEVGALADALQRPRRAA